MGSEGGNQFAEIQKQVGGETGIKVISMEDVQENGVRKRVDLEASFVMVYVDEVKYVTISKFQDRPIKITIPKGGYFIEGEEEGTIVFSMGNGGRET